MDETTKAIIESITETSQQPRALESGHQVTVFYNCLQLTPSELARLAAEATGDLDEDAFDLAVGVAYTGIFFAAAVAAGRKVAILQADGKIAGPSVKGRRVIIVDDVVHRGSRLRRAAEVVSAAGAEIVGYACIVDRSGGSSAALSQALGSAPLFSSYSTEMV